MGKICLLTEESVAFVNGVVITTAHMAKGLEFDEVIVPFVTDKNYRTEIDRRHGGIPGTERGAGSTR